MENPNIPESRPIPTQREQAIKGMKMFIEASRVCPASIIAQSAFIAARCKKLGGYPLKLGLALLAEPELVQKVVGRANESHTRKGKSYVVVNEEAARNIIFDDFSTATDMLVLDQNDLEQIYIRNYQTRHTKSEEEVNGGKFEDWMFEEFQELLQKVFDSRPITS